MDKSMVWKGGGMLVASFVLFVFLYRMVRVGFIDREIFY